MLEVRFILNVVHVRSELLPIRQQGADVVSFLLVLQGARSFWLVVYSSKIRALGFLMADFDSESIVVGKGMHTFERAILSLLDVLKHSVGDLADVVGPDTHTVEVFYEHFSVLRVLRLKPLCLLEDCAGSSASTSLGGASVG